MLLPPSWVVWGDAVATIVGCYVRVCGMGLALLSGSSLLGVMNRCSTAMGARVLRSWLRRPCRSHTVITARHDAVAALVNDAVARQDIAKTYLK